MKYAIVFGISFVVGLIFLFFTGDGRSGFYTMAFMPFFIQIALMIFAVWFGIMMIDLQKERNSILADISKKLEQ